MTSRAVPRLIVKDLALMRRSLVGYTLAAATGVALAAMPPTRSAGVTLALNVLIGVSFHVMLQTVLGERERGTLPFVMCLPVTPGQVAAAKLLSAYLQFAIPGAIAATALVFLSPVDVFHAMATSDRSVLSHAAGWTAYYALVLGAWIFFFSIVLAAAIVSESVGWTIAVLTGLIFVVGNVLMQIAPRMGWVVRFMRDLGRGGAALSGSLLVEAIGIVLIVAATVALQRRKTSFV